VTEEGFRHQEILAGITPWNRRQEEGLSSQGETGEKEDGALPRKTGGRHGPSYRGGSKRGTCPEAPLYSPVP
jgi:hypothetical protein